MAPRKRRSQARLLGVYVLWVVSSPLVCAIGYSTYVDLTSDENTHPLIQVYAPVEGFLLGIPVGILGGAVFVGILEHRARRAARRRQPPLVDASGDGDADR